MQTIFSYGINPAPTVISLPEGARILTAASQGTQVMLWALVDTEKPLVARTFVCLGVGYTLPVDESLVGYISTVFLQGLVFHVFEVHGPIPECSTQYYNKRT